MLMSHGGLVDTGLCHMEIWWIQVYVTWGFGGYRFMSVTWQFWGYRFKHWWWYGGYRLMSHGRLRDTDLCHGGGMGNTDLCHGGYVDYIQSEPYNCFYMSLILNL